VIACPDMVTEVVIPLCRTAILTPMLASFTWDPPDIVTLVTNQPRELLVQERVFPFELRALRFHTTAYGQGKHDVALRRNVGAYASSSDTLCYFDDDQIASIGMLSAGRRLLENGEVAVWGNYRFIKFNSVNLNELPLVEAHHGRTREPLCNRLGLWQSAFGGLLFIHRETLLEVNGFDMLFTRCSGEDQHLALRLGQLWMTVHEPPFAWHPEERLPTLQEPRRTACEACVLEPETVRDVDIVRCAKCGYAERANMDTVPKNSVLPFDASKVEHQYEQLR
jgi:hypothetical protein